MSQNLAEYLEEYEGVFSVSLNRLEQLHHDEEWSLTELVDKFNTDLKTLCMRMSKADIKLLCDACERQMPPVREKLNYCSERCEKLDKGKTIICPGCGDRIGEIGRWVAHQRKDGHYGEILMKTCNYSDDMSVSWKAQRRVALHQADGVCQICNDEAELHVHHLIKRRFFDKTERSHAVENLVVLCNSCHALYEDSGAKTVMRDVVSS
jgi:5-methylcytosine-specific restriction endonuclease McrA